MGYLIDINNLLAEQELELSGIEANIITQVVDALLENLAVNVLNTAASYTNYGAPAAIIAGNAIAEQLRNQKVNNG